MTIVQITPGTGGMYCGNCFRDNALVAELRKLGHSTLLVPLYLPMTLEEEDQSAGTPVFFGGINVYLEQKSAFFRKAPKWLHDALASPVLLKLAAGSAAKTKAEDLGDLTLSMLRGEEGHQARELDALLAWLKTHGRPQVICLSNALLVGLVRRLRSELSAPVVCMLQGEDAFLDALPSTHRAEAWKVLSERAVEADLMIAPSRYFGGLMQERLGFSADKLRVVFNGINLDGFQPAATPPAPPVLGFFARMCREKGLDTLVEAYVLLRQSGRIKNLKLRVGGGCGAAEEPFVASLRDHLKAKGLLGDVEFQPNLDRASKQAFLRSLSVFSVPALYGEAFGLYVIEALASGVPLVQPRHAAFPELMTASGGGVLCEPGDPKALAESIEQLLANPDLARGLAEAGRMAAQEKFSVSAMARGMLAAFQEVASHNG